MDCKMDEIGELRMRKQPPHLCCSGYDNGNCDDAGDFECNICLDLAHDPVVTLCGHLFCWPCLYEWLHFYSPCLQCPVCKSAVDKERLVPLYGRGKKSADPRSKLVPHRPVGHRQETVNLLRYGNAGSYQQPGQGMEFEI